MVEGPLTRRQMRMKHGRRRGAVAGAGAEEETLGSANNLPLARVLQVGPTHKVSKYLEEYKFLILYKITKMVSDGL